MTTTHPHADLIDRLGGPAKLAKKLDLNGAHDVQRVSNWKRRGIPEIWLLRRPDVFQAAEQPAPQGEVA